jgi:SAM-dependent methyltransferase
MDSSNPSSVIQQNVSYYNEIAEQYDATLDKDHSNTAIRKQVADLLSSLVPSGVVLDFGGGTGRDMQWLSAKGYQVIFCEPSAGMREKAVLYNKKNPSPHPVVFLDNTASDFTTWQNGLPFSQKADAVLANFAVLNNIPDLELLFTNLSLVTKPGAPVLLLVLNSDFRKRWLSSRRRSLLSLFTGATVTIYTRFNNQQQKVHLYTVAKIKRAAAAYFDFRGQRSLNDFMLVHLTRK